MGCRTELLARPPVGTGQHFEGQSDLAADADVREVEDAIEADFVAVEIAREQSIDTDRLSFAKPLQLSDGA